MNPGIPLLLRFHCFQVPDNLFYFPCSSARPCQKCRSPMLPCQSSEDPSNTTYSETSDQTRLSYDIFDPTNNTFLKAHRAGHFISWTFGLVKRLRKINVDSLCWNSIGNFCSFLIEKSITGQQTPCLFSTIVFLSSLLFYISFYFFNKKHAHNAFSQNHCQSLQHIV